MMTVAIAEPLSLPHRRTQITVATEVAAMLTMLLPTRIVESSFS